MRSSATHHHIRIFQDRDEMQNNNKVDDTHFLTWARNALNEADIAQIVDSGKSYEPFLKEESEKEFVEGVRHPFDTGEWGSGLSEHYCERLYPMFFERVTDLSAHELNRFTYAAGICLDSFGREHLLSGSEPPYVMALSSAICAYNDLDMAIVGISLMSRVCKRGEPTASITSVGLMRILASACRATSESIDPTQILGTMWLDPLATPTSNEVVDWRVAAASLEERVLRISGSNRE